MEFKGLSTESQPKSWDFVRFLKYAIPRCGQACALVSQRNPFTFISARRRSCLAFGQHDPETISDIWMLGLVPGSHGGERTPRQFLHNRFAETAAAFSPDGQW